MEIGQWYRINYTIRKKANRARGFSLYEPPLPHRRRFRSENVAVILGAPSDVSRRVFDLPASARTRAAVFLARPPHFRRAATRLDPDRAGSTIPDCRSDSDGSVPVSEIENSDVGKSVEARPMADAAGSESPALARRLVVALASHPRRCCRARTPETLNKSEINI